MKGKRREEKGGEDGGGWGVGISGAGCRFMRTASEALSFRQTTGVFSGYCGSQSRLQWRGARRARWCRKCRRDNYNARDKIMGEPPPPPLPKPLRRTANHFISPSADWPLTAGNHRSCL